MKVENGNRKSQEVDWKLPEVGNKTTEREMKTEQSSIQDEKER
jgi:hypothetical protein